MKKYATRILIILVFIGFVFLLATNEGQGGTAYSVHVPMVYRTPTIPFGTATHPGFLKDAAYSRITNEHFSILVPEVAGMYWYVKGGDAYLAHGWADMDYIVSYAEENGHDLVYHALRWWYPTDDDTAHPHTWEEISLWITEATLRYPQITNWIIVNEGYWLGTPDIPYIKESYSLARQLCPGDVLWYNGILTEITEQRIALELIDDDYVDKIGIQAHLDANSDLSVYDWFLAELVERGTPWAITELDIAIPDTTEYWVYLQAAKYSEVRTMATEYGAASITFWEFTDKYNWISNGDLYSYYAAPYDFEMQPKPAWYAIAGDR